MLSTAVQSGLKFPIRILNYHEDIPSNVFGVFVGVERSKYDKLKEWPEDVHGCIGSWDQNYKVLNNQKIAEEIIRVSRDATWNDDRRKYFKRSIYIDLYAKYKIYYILLPVREINHDGIIKNTKIKFNNKRFGLIVVDSSDPNNRAAYLPEVFPENYPWTNIKKSLLKKANISKVENIKFYSYECIIHSITIADYFFNPIVVFINRNYKHFIPYKIDENQNIIIDKSEDVRNLATIFDLIQMEKFGYKFLPKVKSAMIENINYYIN